MRTDARILVVDDDDAIRTLVATILRRKGIGFDLAKHGGEAFERIKRRRYALVILDLMMPQMNGYELLDRLGSLPADSAPRVLVLSAGIEPKQFNSSIVVGMLHKPFDIQLLMDVVSACLATDRTQVARSQPDDSATVQPEKPN